ncbi:MAG TPA: mechanosensitive ion channel [Saprospiraceae bacterium]|nr:mechanosensitive ion channel [Saprospiraceae bacterium]HPK08740.1 mechanosensitive ion channel [Saprospiraceae bacterium]HPQ20396.1 mechanosensitive ion channel [Saprospiraceae bacterium]HRX27960.1 mechanosensitive ion channel [Saprospiraceae bacterium]
MDSNTLIKKSEELFVDYAPKVLLAIITLIIGMWVIKKISNLLAKVFQNSGLDETLSKFLSSLINIALKVMLLLSVATMFGVNTTSFVAIFGALMVGVGMALNGTLGQAASGILLMIFKPYKVGDLVTIGSGGKTGVVDAINAFNTTLKTMDNKRIIIGNTSIISNDIINISGQGIVGVELTFGIAYSADIDKARQVILEVGKSCPYILEEPAQGVVVGNLGDSSVDLATRPFCKSEHYWDVMFYMQENVKKSFDKSGVSIPFNTMDVNIVRQN